MDAVTIATTAAAVSAVAALVSVLAIVAQVVLQWRSTRPRVVVEGTTTTLMSRTAMGETRFGIEVRNVGLLAVVVTGVGVILPRTKERFGYLIDARTIVDERILPKTLQPGEAITLTDDLSPIVEMHQTKHVNEVFARTASGRRYLGKIKINWDSLAVPTTDGR